MCKFLHISRPKDFFGTFALMLKLTAGIKKNVTDGQEGIIHYFTQLIHNTQKPERADRNNFKKIYEKSAARHGHCIP